MREVVDAVDIDDDVDRQEQPVLRLPLPLELPEDGDFLIPFRVRRPGGRERRRGGDDSDATTEAY
jgi:hypothetical protein